MRRAGYRPSSFNLRAVRQIGSAVKLRNGESLLIAASNGGRRRWLRTLTPVAHIYKGEFQDARTLPAEQKLDTRISPKL